MPASVPSYHAAIGIPYVVETTAKGERGYDIFSRLLVERIICLNGAIDDTTAAITVAQVLYLEAQNPEEPISLYINSPGGAVTAGLAIYDTMQFVQSPIATMCVGQACSMASLLLAGGAPGMRRALPNARIMVHQPHGGVSGQASDIAIHTREMLALKSRLYGLFATHTGRTLNELEQAMDRDTFLAADEAVHFGLIDAVSRHRGAAPLGPEGGPGPGQTAGPGDLAPGPAGAAAERPVGE